MRRILALAFSITIVGLLAIYSYQTLDNGNAFHTKDQAKLTLSKIAVQPLAKSGSSGNFAELEVDVAQSNFPSKVMVYKAKKPDLTKDKILAQAAKLGISGDITESDIDFSIKSPNGDYIVDKASGADVYMTKEFELQAFPLKTILSDDEYKKLATDFLIEKGLMKEDAFYKGVNRGNTYTSGDETVKQSPFMIEVGFGRKDLNGIEWAGVGPRITVQFGENGRIIGADSVWREVEPHAEYPVISLDEAVNQVRAGKATIYNVDLNDKGTINEARLVYMSESVGVKQEFVIPYYKLSGKTSAGRPFMAYTRAIPENLLVEIQPIIKAPPGNRIKP